MPPPMPLPGTASANASGSHAWSASRPAKSGRIASQAASGDGAAAISSAVEEQGAATQDISRNVADALGETAHVASNISGVREAAGATTSIAAEVLAAAEGLSQRVDALRGETERFLARVRAA